MNRPFFSVIIPTLNEEKYLPRLLASLASQTYRDFEVLVVDGQSDDGTVKVAQSYRKVFSGLRVLQIERRNVSFARNNGARAAGGEYDVFVDSDVVLPSMYLELIKKAIDQKHAHLLTTWYKPDSRNPLAAIIFLALNVQMELVQLFGHPYAPGFNIVAQASVFKEIGGFDEQLKIAEDYDLVLRFVKKWPLVILHRPVITSSVRRFQLFGYFKTIAQWVMGSLAVILKTPAKLKTIVYPMGGHLYGQRSKATQKKE